MAGVKTNTVTYVFEGETRDLEESIKRLSNKFQNLRKKKDDVMSKMDFGADTKDLFDAYSRIVKMQRGVRSLFKRGQGFLTKQDKDDLKTLRTLRKEIEAGLADPESFESSKDIDKFEKKVRKALRIASKLRRRALEVESKQELKDAKAREKEEARMATALTPAEQAAAQLNIERFNKLKKYADLENPQEAAFIGTLSSKAGSYQQALDRFNAEQERYNSLVVKGEEDVQRLKVAERELALATLEVNDAYKEGIANLRKMAQLRRDSDKRGGRNVLRDFAKKLYSQSLRQIASTIISSVINAVKNAIGEMAKVFEPFNKAMTELTSNIRYAMNSIATIISPIIQLITPALVYLSEVIARVATKVAELFNAIAGNKQMVIAKKNIEDYADSLNKLKGNGGLDELNKLDTQQSLFAVVDIKGLDSLKGIGELLKSITLTIEQITNPLLDILLPTLTAIAGILGAIGTLLAPITTFIGYVAGGVLGVIGKAIGAIVSVLATMFNHLEILIPAAAAFVAIWALFNWQSFINILVLVIGKFISLTAAIWGAVKAAVGWVAQSIKTIVKNVAQAVSAWVAEKAYWKLALAIIAAAGMAAALVAGIVLTSVAATSAQTSSYQGSNPATVALASGGVVAAPTLALVGEGRYPEAVVPLGQSPQFQSMKEGIATEVAGMLLGSRNGSPSASDRPIVLNIDGKTIARALWPNLIDTQYQVGVKLK